VTLLAVRGNLYEVIATGGDPFLGGDDIDDKIADYLAVEFLKQHRIDPNADPIARARLLLAAEQIKVYLSSELVAEGTLAEVAYGEGGAPLSLDFRVERRRLEDLIEPLVSRSLEMAVGVLAEAGVSPERVDEVILVGGSTRVPMIQRRVAEYFGRQPKANINPMHVVALGAAAQAHSLFYPDDKRLGSGGGGGGGGGVLIDVTPHSLGIQTAGGYTQRLIEKNTRIPAEGRKVFTTTRNDQTSVQIKVCQGEQQRYAENVPLGELTLDGIPKMPRGEPQLEVAFFIDADGIVQVSAVELRSNTKAKASLSAIGVNEDR
jgi:molecular chaperone DnaK